MKPTQALSVYPTDYGFGARVGDRYQDFLTQDEALWVVATYLMGNSTVGFLRTAAEHEAFEERIRSGGKT
jgi:hypothetical protein